MEIKDENTLKIVCNEEALGSDEMNAKRRGKVNDV